MGSLLETLDLLFRQSSPYHLPTQSHCTTISSREFELNYSGSAVLSVTPFQPSAMNR